MSEAAAQHAGQGALNLGLGGFGVLVEESFGGHNDAVDAKPALRGAFLNEGLLKRVRMGGRPDSLKRDDFLALHGFHGGEAGANGAAVCDDGTGSALAEAAAEFGAVQGEVVG